MPFRIILCILFASIFSFHSLAQAPGSCQIKGKVLKIERKKKGQPCKANIRILEQSKCGSGVTIPIDGEIRIVFSNRGKYRLLKKGDFFSATAYQRLSPKGGYWVINDYLPFTPPLIDKSR